MKSSLVLLGIYAMLGGLAACGEKGSTEAGMNIVLYDSVAGITQPPAPGVYRLKDERMVMRQWSGEDEQRRIMQNFNDSIVRALRADGIVVTDFWHRSGDLCMRSFVDGGMVVQLRTPNPRILEHGFDTLPAASCSMFWYHYRVEQ